MKINRQKFLLFCDERFPDWGGDAQKSDFSKISCLPFLFLS